MSSTHVAGSDEDFDVVCDPCYNDGQRVQATGHCKDCNENMCGSCMTYHKKLSAVKGHFLQDKSTLSHSEKARENEKKSTEEKDPLIDRCPKHKEELIKFYCDSHLTLACSICVSLDHRLCKDMTYIRDVANGIANSYELKQFQADLQSLVAKLTSTQSRTKWIKQSMNDTYSQTVADISNLKKEIIDMLNELENRILEKASLINNKKVDILDSTLSACESVIRETKELIADTKNKKMMNHDNRLFILMKTAKSRLRDLADEADELYIKSKYERLSFQPDEQLRNLQSTLASLGEIVMVGAPRSAKANYKHDINVTSKSDTQDCDISGIVVLSDGRLALTDYDNKSVKLVDLTKRKVSAQYKLLSPPLDITSIEGTEVAVTTVEERCIHVLSVPFNVSKTRSINVSGLYRGIEYISEKFILVCRYPKSGVHIYDMSGTLLQQIETDHCGNKLFTLASRIAISPDHGTLYVSDYDAQTIVSLTIDGQLISIYNENMLQCPCGIAVHDDGRVFVCIDEIHSVYQLSPSGLLRNILLKQKDGLQLPFAIALGDGSMYISSGSDDPAHCNIIKVYRLEK